MTATIPSDTHVGGDAGHTTDHNNIADVLGLLTQAMAGIAGKPGQTAPGGNAANVAAVQSLTTGIGGDIGLQPSGDTTGTTDTAAINGMLGATAGAVATLGAGTFYIKSDILLQAAGQQLAGQQIKGSVIQAVAGGTFTTGIVAITADRCGVHDVLFQNASGTITSNPAASAIVITGSFHTFLENIEGIFVNGWLVDLESTSSSTNIYMRHVIGRTCAGGIKLSGPASGQAIGANLDACGTAQIGVNSGPFANLDALYMYRVTDVTLNNCSFSTNASTTGHGVHMVAVANVYWTVFDSGGFPFPAAGSGQCGFLIDGNATDGNTSGVTISHGVVQTWDVGVRVTGNCTNVNFEDVTIGGNFRHGMQIDTGFANSVFVRDCRFGVTSGTNGNTTATFAYTATSAAPAVFTVTGYSPVNGQPVQLGATGLPTGFATATTYYVVNASGNTAQLAATVGGAAITSTSTGSGTLNLISYDLFWNTNAATRISVCEFNSGIVAVGVAGVQASIGIRSGNATQVIYPRFTGSGAASTNWYTNTPPNAAAAFIGALAASVSYTPANPASTVSATLVMMGLGSTCVFTPTATGKVLATVTGYGSTATAAVNFTVGARFGTGTAPVNGAAVTGTRFGATADPALRGVAVSVPGGAFAFTAVLSLTAGTAYWFDLALLSSNAADAAGVSNIAVSLTELPS